MSTWGDRQYISAIKNLRRAPDIIKDILDAAERHGFLSGLHAMELCKGLACDVKCLIYLAETRKLAFDYPEFARLRAEEAEGKAGGRKKGG